MTTATALTLCDQDLSLATDLYQLTMAAVHHQRRPMPRATFELFVRHLPEPRNFLVFAGLEQALAALVRLRFSPQQVEYLRTLPPFRSTPDSFFETLLEFRFRADVRAMREGTIFFPGEPVLQVSGTLFEAQLVETLLLSIVNFQTMIASKAARVRLAAGDQVELAEFGGRRAHGPQAAAWVARAAYLAGFDSTSNVLAGEKLGVPVVGTMAHSFILSYDSEEEAFRAYRSTFPEYATLLVDTFDTLEGVRRAAEIGSPLAGIRLDSGDVAALATAARRILDEHQLPEAKIFASGDMNEFKIAEIRRSGAPIDAFGVGTQLATSADAPFIGGIYKLVEIELNGRVLPRFKSSVGKATYPGRKQVLRTSLEGRMRGDRIVPLGDDGDDMSGATQPLLQPVMERGRILVDWDMEATRAHVRDQVGRLPSRLRSLERAEPPYPVAIDEALEALRSEHVAAIDAAQRR